MTSVRRLVGACSLVLLVAGAAALAYTRWTRAIDAADALLARGDLDAALGAYTAMADRFDHHPRLREIGARDYARVSAARLWIEHRLGRYDAVIADADRAPAAAQPHFWAGLAWFEKSRADTSPEEQTAALMHAEDELRQAVDAAPEDWDAKYDFELVTRLAAALRQQPRTPPDQLMQLLRPQPRAGARPPRRVG